MKISCCVPTKLFLWKVHSLYCECLCGWLSKLLMKVSPPTNMHALCLHDIVCGCNYNEVVENKTLLRDFNFPCKIEKRNWLVCVLTKCFFFLKNSTPHLNYYKIPLKIWKNCVWEFCDWTATSLTKVHLATEIQHMDFSYHCNNFEGKELQLFDF